MQHSSKEEEDKQPMFYRLRKALLGAIACGAPSSTTTVAEDTPPVVVTPEKQVLGKGGTRNTSNSTDATGASFAEEDPSSMSHDAQVCSTADLRSPATTQPLPAIASPTAGVPSLLCLAHPGASAQADKCLQPAGTQLQVQAPKQGHEQHMLRGLSTPGAKSVVQGGSCDPIQKPACRTLHLPRSNDELCLEHVQGRLASGPPVLLRSMSSGMPDSQAASLSSGTPTGGPNSLGPDAHIHLGIKPIGSEKHAEPTMCVPNRVVSCTVGRLGMTRPTIKRMSSADELMCPDSHRQMADGLMVIGSPAIDHRHSVQAARGSDAGTGAASSPAAPQPQAQNAGSAAQLVTIHTPANPIPQELLSPPRPPRTGERRASQAEGQMATRPGTDRPAIFNLAARQLSSPGYASRKAQQQQQMRVHVPPAPEQLPTPQASPQWPQQHVQVWAAHHQAGAHKSQPSNVAHSYGLPAAAPHSASTICATSGHAGLHSSKAMPGVQGFGDSSGANASLTPSASAGRQVLPSHANHLPPYRSSCSLDRQAAGYHGAAAHNPFPSQTRVGVSGPALALGYPAAASSPQAALPGGLPPHDDQLPSWMQMHAQLRERGPEDSMHVAASAPIPQVAGPPQRSSSMKRTLNVSSTQLQEAVKAMLDRQKPLGPPGARAARPAAPLPPPPPPPHTLHNELETLDLDNLESELFGLVLIGRGGGGAVFRAIWQGAQVAVKFMVGKTPASVSLSALEAVLAASVNHPHVVQTYGFDVAKVRDHSFHVLSNFGATSGSTPNLMSQQQAPLPSTPFGSQVVASIMKELEKEKERMQELAAGGGSGHTSRNMPPTPSSVTISPGPLNSVPPAPWATNAPEAQQEASSANSPATPQEGEQGAQDILATFQSDEGFGQPAEVKPVDCWSLREVLGAMKAQPGMYLTHIIMEYCDRGTLLAALQRGVFSLGGTSGDVSRFNERVVLRAALRTARDVAHGMQHLHKNDIIHGDLKPGNVLLRGSRTDRRGFTAKVADFGLSKVVTNDAPLEMHHWSTVTHMAPEVVQGTWCKQSDVYSFGVLLWQLMCGEPQPFKHLTVPQVITGVSQGWLHLPWPRSCHPAVAKLGMACMAHNPGMRPNFQEIGAVLLQIEQNVRDELRYLRAM